MEATTRHHHSRLPDVSCCSDKWSIQNGLHKKKRIKLYIWFQRSSTAEIAGAKWASLQKLQTGALLLFNLANKTE